MYSRPWSACEAPQRPDRHSSNTQLPLFIISLTDSEEEMLSKILFVCMATLIGAGDETRLVIAEDGANWSKVRDSFLNRTSPKWTCVSLCCQASKGAWRSLLCLKPYLFSTHPWSSSKRACAFLCLLYNSWTCGTFWGAGADEPSGRSHATFRDNEPCNAEPCTGQSGRCFSGGFFLTPIFILGYLNKHINRREGGDYLVEVKTGPATAKREARRSRLGSRTWHGIYKIQL